MDIRFYLKVIFKQGKSEHPQNSLKIQISFLVLLNEGSPPPKLTAQVKRGLRSKQIAITTY